MESLGKSRRIDGSPAIETPCAVIGQTGSEAQHTFLQALHQGTQVIPAEFIGVATPRHDHRDHHLAMARNLVGQAEALARGRSIAQTRAMLERQGCSASEVDRLLPHRTFAGNRPSTIITLKQLDARCLGALLALFEHRVHGMATAWSINAFDQWGVELGKTVAGQLASSSDLTDSARAALGRLGVE
jgi:glucose-6-phosphate isomerase